MMTALFLRNKPKRRFLYRMTFFIQHTTHPIIFHLIHLVMLSIGNRSPQVYYRYARRCASSVTAEVPNPSSFPVFLLGIFSGGLGSLVGMGGSFIALPFLTGMFKLSQHHAHGTSIAVVLATATGGSIAYVLREQAVLERLTHSDAENIPTMIGDVHLLTAATVALSSSMTVVLGAKLSKILSPHVLRVCMMSFLFLMAPVVPYRDAIQDWLEGKHHEHHKEADHDSLKDLPNHMVRPLGIGACAGVLSGMFGVGGGTIMVPALSLFTDLDHQVALGTSLAGIVLYTIA